MKFEKHINIERSDTTIVDTLEGASNLSRQAIKQTMKRGAVWLTREDYTQRTRRADKRLKPGDIVHIYYDEAVLSTLPAHAELIADEETYSLWYKPYGMLCQGSKWGDHCTINRWAETHLSPQRPAFIVHRLDKAASGLILIAHTKKTAAQLSDQFQTREVEKKYHAIVKGHFPKDVTLNNEIDGKAATSHVKLMEHSEKQNRSLVEVAIETGRKHQIRKHLSGAGFPILGDRLYDQNIEEHDPDLSLVSCYLSFRCPKDNQTKTYTLPQSKLPRLSG